jgi:two-component system cell cycle response regulator
MRVLLAGATAEASHGLAVLLRRWGYDPTIVQDGRGALAVLRASNTPALAVVDESLPGLNGIEVCREIWKDSVRLRTYVILLTARSGPDQILLGLESGVADYLVQPVDADELQACLRTGEHMLALEEQLLATERLLQAQAKRDAPTELRNRALILEILDDELARQRRKRHLLSVILVDLDPSQRTNHLCGHRAGDDVLRQTAQRLRAVLRPGDNVGRYGDKKFLLVLPDCGAGQALWLAERLRRDVAREPVLEGGEPIPVTLSLGVAGWDAEQPASELLRTVEGALDCAKSAGGNHAVYSEGVCD